MPAILLSWIAIASLAISVIVGVDVSVTSGPSSCLGSCSRISVGAAAAKQLQTGRGSFSTSGLGGSVHGEVGIAISIGWALASNTSGASCGHSAFGIRTIGFVCEGPTWLSGIEFFAR